MSHPSDETLAGFVLGEAHPTVAEHVSSCSQCAYGVAELRRTVGLAHAVSQDPVAAGGWSTPPPSVWAAIEASLDDEDHPVTSAQADWEPTVRPAGATGPTETPARSRRRVRWTAAWAAGLAAASLLVGLGLGHQIWAGRPPTPTPSPTVAAPAPTVAAASLDTLDTKQQDGRAVVVRTQQGLDLEVAPYSRLDPGDGYLEVWLINTDLKRMVSVGVLRPGESGRFTMNQRLMDQGYTIVDISLQQYNGSPLHSGHSLLRGRLTT
ncbi:MAG TPA: anti-sigma factor [Intrasporangium sp.]|nr:anti-sigma factor [Intrasporangium sp.]